MVLKSVEHPLFKIYGELGLTPEIFCWAGEKRPLETLQCEDVASETRDPFGSELHANIF